MFCFVQIYVFQNLTFSFSYYSKMCCNILREDDSEIISPLFKKKPIQLKDLFWWKKYVIYFFLVETMKFSSLILRHTLNGVGAQGGAGGSIFEKFQGGAFFWVLLHFYVTISKKISNFSGSQEEDPNTSPHLPIYLLTQNWIFGVKYVPKSTAI